jgi:uncharacterized protein (DUF1501 family)
MNRTFTRRRFLAAAGATTGAAAVALTLGDLAPWSHATAATGPAGPLVLVTLYGGNDGLNTVVPYSDPAYHSARPNLGYAPNQVLELGHGLGLNPKLTGLHGLWKSGSLAIVLGVGYPEPNLSHFASMDIWQTASLSGLGPGWLGQWLDATGDDPLRAISVGNTLPPALRGAKASATAVTAPSIDLPGGPALASAYAALAAPDPSRSGMAADAAAAAADLLSARARLDALSPAATPAGTDLASQLGVVSALILAGAPTRVYQVSLSTFDTHADEKATHETLLGDLDGALTGFLSKVTASPAGRGTVVMTYSEFGRRPAENASGGTDHGAAAPLFIAGHPVKGGRFYGEQPSLTQLDPNGNLVFNVDFRSVYSTMLERVVGVEATPFVGGRFPVLDVI